MRNILKKSTIYLFVIGLLILDTGQSIVGAEEKQSDLVNDAKSAILIERDTGEILYSKDPHEQLPPASLTKIMTLLIIMEEIEAGNLKKNEFVSVSEYAASMGGSQIFLEAGEKMSVDDLLKAIAIASGNDASVALAEKISGSESAFVKRMNDKANELGLENTKFGNVTGLPGKDHYSTAHDLAIISKELLAYEDITNYTSIYEDYLRQGEENEFWLVNTNRLVRFHDDIDGLKTGYTKEAKFCLSATAERDNMRVISVIMGAESSKDRNKMTVDLLDYGFNQYEAKKIYAKGRPITKLKHFKGNQNEVDVVTKEPISIVGKKGKLQDNITEKIIMDEQLTLPLIKGQKVGKIQLKIGKETVYETDLILEEDIKPASFLTLWKRSVQKLAKNHES